MKLYHYACWRGPQIIKEGVIKPSKVYSFGGDTLVAPWPKVVFLTRSPDWEPSIQAKSKEGYWEKCESRPEIYDELGIPCWRFTVHTISHPVLKVTDYIPMGQKWRYMLADAITLNSDINDWYMSDFKETVTKSEGLNSSAELLLEQASRPGSHPSP